MFERFTKDAHRAIFTSIRTAADCGAAKAAPEHLLLGLLADDQGIAARVLARFDVTTATLNAAAAPPTRRAGLTDEEIAALSAIGISADEVFRRIEEAFGPDALDEPSPPRPLRRRGRVGGPFNPQAKKVMELSLREAIALSHRQVSSGHILLALLRQGVAAPMSTVLTNHGVTYNDARGHMLAELHKTV